MNGFRIGLAAAALALGVTAASAQSIVKTDNVEARLIADVQTVAPGETFTVALRQKIRTHWHTYWKNPGDSGEPTAITWSLPQGVTAGAIQWPAPERLPVGPLMNFGYSDTVLLLTEITVPANFAPGTLALEADATWLVCERICIPEEGKLSLALPVREATSAKSEWAKEIAETRQTLPHKNPWETTFAADEDEFRLFISGLKLEKSGVESVAFFPEEPDVIAHAAPQGWTVVGGLILQTKPGRVMKPTGGKTPPDVVKGVLVVHQKDGAKNALEVTANRGLWAIITGPLMGLDGQATGFAGGTEGTADGWEAFFQAMIFAFIGGLILNLMPCVFPVLSMKGLSLLNKAGKGSAVARTNGIAYTIGVIATFLVVAFILITLRAAGDEIGWGFQFQSPIMVSATAILFFIVGLNLSGVFEIAGSFQGVGRSLSQMDGTLGSFFTGILAVVVATPCTAPFMAGAVGFALLQSTPIALAVFASLGLGMALPFLVISMSPWLLRYLPKPGAWMVRLKELLAFPMYASAVWLIWVLSQQTDTTGVTAVLASMVAIAFAAWAWGIAQRNSVTWGRVGAVVGVAAAITLLALSPIASDQTTAEKPKGDENAAIPYEPFSPERLAQLRDLRKPVFVNLTAAWCITCLLNEEMALSSERMAETFRTRGIVYLKGDWTNKDPVIARVLKQYGRSGVPLYLYFSPGALEAKILPQILTEGELIDTLGVVDTAHTQ
jgi:thiol:disulfide interchange protein/DsbC/DsbD-like thiol-disulfide interchange protein